MAKQEITLKGLDGHEDHLVYDAADGQMSGSLEDCARSMFPVEGETTPRLRFQGFEGEWEKKLLSDCLEISDEKNTENLYGIDDVLSVSDDFGVVNQIELLGRSYAGKSVSGYKILRPGQIVYTKSPLRQKPYGIVKVNRGKTGIVSVLYAVYNVKEGVSAEYLHYYFDPAWRLNAYMRPLVNKGAKNTMNISDETALTGYIMIPKDIAEQERIASFLQRLDTQISMHHQQFERLKELKSACLGSMFPRESQITPSIRFSNFNEKWIMNKIGKLATTYSGGTPTAGVAEYYGGKIPFIRSGEIHQNETELYLTELGLKRSSAKLVCKGTILYAMYGATSGEVDISKVNGAINQAILAIIPNDALLSPFLSYLLQGRKKHIVDTYIQGGQGNLSGNLIKEYTIAYPSNISEQEQIASFFDNLDTQITTEQQQLNKLKQMKSACLRSMFPQNGGG